MLSPTRSGSGSPSALETAGHGPESTYTMDRALTQSSLAMDLSAAVGHRACSSVFSASSAVQP